MQYQETILTAMFFENECWLMQTDKAFVKQQTCGPLPYEGSTNFLLADDHDFRLAGKGVTGKLSAQAVWKHVTIHLDALQIIAGFDWWPYEPEWIPSAWHVDVSMDGDNYVRALSVDQFQSNLSAGYLISAPCHGSTGDTGLLPLRAKHLRFSFDESSQGQASGEWAIEIRLRSQQSNGMG
jgi:hypothetical protein